MNVSILTAVNQNAPAISAGSKAGAILIGVAFLVVVYVMTAFITGHWRFKELFNGFDGFASTSKLQWLLWLIAILFGYVALWVLRAEHGDYTALSDIPVNILTVLGFSTGTAAAAKGITAGYVETRKVAKTGVPANPTPRPQAEFFRTTAAALSWRRSSRWRSRLSRSESSSPRFSTRSSSAISKTACRTSIRRSWC